MCHTGLSWGEQGCRSPRSSVFLRHRHRHPWVEMAPGLRTNHEQKDLPAPRLDLKCGQDQPLWIVSLTKRSFSGWHTPQEPHLHTHTNTHTGGETQDTPRGSEWRPDQTAPCYLWDPLGTWPEVSVLSPDPVPEALDETLTVGLSSGHGFGITGGSMRTWSCPCVSSQVSWGLGCV